MEPNSKPINPFPRMETEELRERRNALKLKTWNTRYIERREI